MAIRKLFKTPTIDARVFWKQISESGGWRIQYNRTLDKTPLLKPYRLLDPAKYLIASADSLDDFEGAALDDLVAEFSQRNALVTKEQVGKVAKTIAAAVFAAIQQRAEEKKKLAGETPVKR